MCPRYQNCVVLRSVARSELRSTLQRGPMISRRSTAALKQVWKIGGSVVPHHLARQVVKDARYSFGACN